MRLLFSMCHQFFNDIKLKESLYLGIGEDEDDVISFIPFLDYKRCKFYATFTPSFEQDRNFNIPGLDKINLRELRSFTN